MAKRSTSRVIRIALNIKFWLEGPPEVTEVRPACCPGCGQSGAPVGERIRLVGHGIRTREIRGPLRAEEKAATRTLFVRRFLCRDCGAVITVVPREVAPGRLYAAGAIALALVLFGVAGLPAEQILERLRPTSERGHDRRRWRVLDRWLSSIREGRLFPRLPAAPPSEATPLRRMSAFYARQLAARSRRLEAEFEALAMDGVMMAIAA